MVRMGNVSSNNNNNSMAVFAGLFVMSNVLIQLPFRVYIILYKVRIITLLSVAYPELVCRGFPNVANVSGRSGSVPVTVSPP